MDPEQSEDSGDTQDEAGCMAWLKAIWSWCTVERVQAAATVVMALVTVWTLIFTPLGERLISEINRTVRETQEELEYHRTLAGKVTLRAIWKGADDRLAENEYFARIAADYQAHKSWIEQSEQRARELNDLRAKVAAGEAGESTLARQEKTPWPIPSMWWRRLPHRDGIPNTIMVPVHEKSRWGERVKEIHDFWSRLLRSDENKYPAYQELRRMLDRLIDAHVQGNGHGAPPTGRSLIEELKRGAAVTQIGAIGSEALRQTFDRFLRMHPELASTTIRVQFEGPYSEEQLIETGVAVVDNVNRFRDTFMSFIKAECGPYF